MINSKHLNILKAFLIILRIKFKKNIFRKKKIVLFPCEPGINYSLSILPLYLAVYKADFNIEIFLSIRDIKYIPIYLLLGVHRFHVLLPAIFGFSSLKNYKKLFDYHKYLIPSILRFYLIDSIESLDNKEKIIESLELKVSNLLKNFSRINFANVKALFLSDYVYIPQGPILEYVYNLHKNVDIYTFNLGHISDTLVINKIESLIDNRHPYSPPLNLYLNNLNSIKSGEEEKIIIKTRESLKSFYTNKDWFNYVGTSFYQTTTIDKNYSSLLSKKNNTHFAIFPHIYWDASVAAGKDLFKNYRDWFESTVRYILKNTNSQITIKDHPSNVFKLKNIGLNYSSPIYSFISQLPNEEKERIIYLTPDSKISTLSVIEKCDYVLTVRGTVGVEACLFQRNVIFAGTGRFNNYNFGLFPKSVQEYYELIKQASENIIPIEKENVLSAAVYLDTLWNNMTFYQKLIKTTFNKKDMSSFKEVTSLDMKFIDHQIDKLKTWFLSPSSTFNT